MRRRGSRRTAYGAGRWGAATTTQVQEESQGTYVRAAAGLGTQRVLQVAGRWTAEAPIVQEARPETTATSTGCAAAELGTQGAMQAAGRDTAAAQRAPTTRQATYVCGAAGRQTRRAEAELCMQAATQAIFVGAAPGQWMQEVM